MDGKATWCLQRFNFVALRDKKCPSWIWKTDVERSLWSGCCNVHLNLLMFFPPPSDLPRHPPQRKRWEHLRDGAASSNHQCHGQRPQAQHLLPQLQRPGRRQQAPGTSRLSNGHWWQPLRRRPQLCAQGLPIYEHHRHPGIKVNLRAKDQKKVKIYFLKNQTTDSNLYVREMKNVEREKMSRRRRRRVIGI